MRFIVQALLTFLLNASWQATLLVGFAALSNWLLREVTARYRHALWIITLLACLMLPLFSATRSRKTSAELPFAGQTQTARSTPVVVTRIISPDVEVPDQPSAEPASSVIAAKRQDAFGASFRVGPRVAFALAGIYVLFLLWRTMVLFRAWRRTQSIVRSSSETPFPESLQSIIRSCCEAIGVQRARILHSPHVPVPITFGVVNPIIVLPDRLLEETDRELLSSAIGHELVHVARRDYFWNLVFELIYLPLSIHPAAALVRRRIRQTRELCCDEVVATKLLRAEVYARSLMQLIGSAPLSRRPMSDTTIGLNQSDILEVRIMSLLKSHSKPRRARIFSILAVLVLLAPCVIAARIALKLNVEQQESAPSATSPGLPEQERSNLKTLEELKAKARELNEKLKGADSSKRAEIEARLVDVQKSLEEHQRALTDVRRQQGDIGKLRTALDQYANNKTADVAQLKRLEAELEKIETEYPRNDSALRELQEKIAVSDRLGQKDRRAKLIYRIEPEYTADAREKNIQGSVLLGVTVDHDGVPQNIHVQRSLYPSLDQSAVEAIKKWRFEPAMKDGQPVSMYMQVEVYFSPGQEKNPKQEAGNDEYEFRGQLRMRRPQEREQPEQGEGSRQADLTREASVPMDRAIQIATSQVPGKVLACSLGRDGANLFYHVVIVTTDGDKTSRSYVWVSAIDGHVIKTEKDNDTAASRQAISGGVLNGKAIRLPNPQYPDIARAARASGTVTVRILVDEQGNVIDAKAVSGHPLLQEAASEAARHAKFAPTSLQGQPVKVTGTILYNFTVQ